MTLLHNPLFINFEGEPVTGRMPPRTVVFGMMDEKQRGMVAHAYKVFCDNVAASAAGYLVSTKKLADGTRVRMTHGPEGDAVQVWPGKHGDKDVLPHGFGVVTNWTAHPKIYRRTLLSDHSLYAWYWDHQNQVPQLQKPVEAENQVFWATPTGVSLNHPMVLGSASPTTRWDWFRHSAPTISSTSPIVPICLSFAGPPVKYDSHLTHYAAENKVFGLDGAVLYTMAISPSILTTSPESPVFASASTTADGSELQLQHLRLAVTSPTFGIYITRFANERLRRTDPATYTAQERNVVSITGPLASSTPPAGVTYSTLNETVNTSELFLKEGYIGTGGVGGTIGTIGPPPQTRYFETFFVHNVPIDITSATAVTETATREEATFSAAAADTYTKTVAAPRALDTNYPDLVVETNATGSVYWRAGFYQKGVASPLTAFPSRAWFGKNLCRKDRIDLSYSRDTAPLVKYPMGWTDVKLLEGTTSGTCTGNRYVDTTTAGRNIAQWDGHYLATDYIFSDAGPSGSLPWAAWIAAADAANILATVQAEVSPYPTTLTDTAVTLVDNRPRNFGGYTLKSRYVIDFDNKGQYYAAIRVEVICSGAEWREDGLYDGHLGVYTTPTYTVNIYFESNWKGAVADQLLLTATATRPAFEFVTVTKQNPYYFLQPWATDKQDTILHLPPNPGLPAEAMTQITTLCSHQGADTHLACADVRADLDPSKYESVHGIEFSKSVEGKFEPHHKYVSGQLYARTFKLSDYSNALWLLHSTKCDATQDDNPLAPGATAWFYMSALGAAISGNTFHVEVRDGAIVNWSDEITGGASPAYTSRDIKLYRV